MMQRALIILLLLSTACVSELAPVPELQYDLEELESTTTPLTQQQRVALDGVYVVEQGTSAFGDTVVGRWIDHRFCLYAIHDVVFAELAGGARQDSIILGGYYRIVRSGRGATFGLGMKADDQTLVGTTSDGEQMSLRRVRDAYPAPPPIHVLAHRGGGRNSERLGVSENSMAMVRYASILGATGVEIDVKQTRDGEIIVFHDDTFSPRTVVGAYLLGRVDAFRLTDIKRYGQLIHGESIPTLDEMLAMIVDSTTLSFVWIDVKDARSVDAIIAAQQRATDHARAVGRTLEIIIGIPTSDVFTAFLRSPQANNIPFLYELDAETALAYPNCRVWAPRWTNGIPSSQIDAMHAQGKLVFTWTLDVRDYIADFLYGSKIDGILTNYPSLVNAMHSVQR